MSLRCALVLAMLSVMGPLLLGGGCRFELVAGDAGSCLMV